MNKILNKPLIILIDAMSYIYRAYYAYPKLISIKTKKPLGSIYGFLNMITSLLTVYYSDYVIFVFDNGKINFRHFLYKKYKSNRKIMPLDLYLQINPIIKIIKYLGFITLSSKGLEADDIIGIISNYYSKFNKFNILISTIDKDIFQLISKNIYVHNIIDNIIYNENNIFNKFGLKKSSLIIDYLSLLGDRTDNILGVPGIGKVSAVKICNYFGSISNLFNNLENIKTISSLKNRLQIYKSIITHKKLIKLNYQLIKIKKNYKLFNYKKFLFYKINFPNKKKILYLLNYLGLNQWVKKIEYLLYINKLYYHI